MTLLSIVQNACGQAPIAAPAAVIGNTGDETAVLCLALANLGGQALARRPQGGWVEMIREYDFTTKATAANIPGTILNVANQGTILVPTSQVSGVTANNWAASGTGVPNNATILSVTPILSNTQIVFNQPSSVTGTGLFQFGQSDYALPSDFQRAIDNTFWDRTRYWSMRGPQSPQQWQVYKSSTIGRASIQRRFRFRRISPASGNSPVMMLSIDPVPFDNGAQLVFEYVSVGWCQSVAGVPQTQWEADTDIGVLDEYLLQLDLNWRLLQRLGLAYSEQLNEAMRYIDKAVAQDGASAILDLTPSYPLHLIGPYQVQESNFPGTFT